MTTAALTTLVIYAYSSFVSSYGVGPTLVKKFESHCQCQVKLVDAGNGGDMVSRIKLEGRNFAGDVVIGIDENFIPTFKEQLGWKQPFVPFEKAPFAFIYNSTIVKDPPHTLHDLLDPKWKAQIIIEDPRLSTVGLGLLLWIVHEKKTGAKEYLEDLKPQIKVVAPGWDLAYGMFKKNQGLLVFSYWTSPAYHIQEEKTDIFKAAKFIDGHFQQVETMTIAPSTKNLKLAQRFLDFMVSKEAQEEIPKRNFMYPALKDTKLPEAFKKLGEPRVFAPMSEDEIKNQLPGWLKMWREVF
jgi:thiamine transport system substrate-binding protein